MRYAARGPWFLLLALSLILAACSGIQFRNYGAIRPDSSAEKSFETFTVVPGLRYYASGEHECPSALLGLHKDYRLDPRTLWRPEQMTPTRMKELVESMQARARKLRLFQYGFRITDPQGREIGIWYSVIEAPTEVRMNEDGTVLIGTPDQDTYERYERDSDYQ